MLLLATLTISCVGTAGPLTIVVTGSYRSVERVAMALGLCELAFIALAWQARPEATEIASQGLQIPLGDRGYLYLLAASLRLRGMIGRGSRSVRHEAHSEEGPI